MSATPTKQLPLTQLYRAILAALVRADRPPTMGELAAAVKAVGADVAAFNRAVRILEAFSLLNRVEDRGWDRHGLPTGKATTRVHITPAGRRAAGAP